MTSWIGHRLPTVRAEWTADDEGVIDRFELVQRGRLEGETWPVNVRLLIARADGTRQERVLGLLAGRTRLRAMEGQPEPRWILLNPRDVEYGQFLLDEHSTAALLEDLPEEADPLLRSTAYAALWETVREGELDPRRFLDTAIRMLRDERDPLTHGRFLGAIRTALDRYLPPDESAARRAQLAALLREQLEAGSVPGQEIGLFRAISGLVDVAGVAGWVVGVLDGSIEIEGLSLGSEDRYRAVGRLIAVGVEGAEQRLDEMEAAAETDVSRSVYVARAARPTAENKAETFRSYFDPEDPPEQWVQQSLGSFHGRGQQHLTLPYLRPALERAEWVKEHRKIFFMPAWLDAFVNAHSSREALEVVQGFLDESPELPEDIRRKLLQSLDGLERAVRIRERWGAR